MQPTLCSRCGKNLAVVFVTKIENGQANNEGLCLKCAKELHIKPVDDMISRMGISDEELDSLSGDMMNAFNGLENLAALDDGDDSGDDDGKTATFPFLNRLFECRPAQSMAGAYHSVGSCCSVTFGAVQSTVLF